MCQIVNFTPHAACRVASHLREQSRLEWIANGIADPVELSLCWDAWNGPKLAVVDDAGKPVFVGGWIRHKLEPRAWSWTAFAEGADKAGALIHKAMFRSMRQLERDGVRRFEAKCLDGPRRLFDWMLRVGFILEGQHNAAGANGETLLTFGRVTGGV